MDGFGDSTLAPDGGDASQGPTPLLELARRFKASAANLEAGAADEIVRHFGDAWREVSDRLDALTRRIAVARSEGTDISPDWLRRQGRMQRFLGDVEGTIAAFADAAHATVRDAQAAAIRAAYDDSTALMRAAFVESAPPGVDPSGIPALQSLFGVTPADVVEQAIGQLDSGGAVGQLFDSFGAAASAAAKSAIVQAVMQGINPRKIAGRVSDALDVSMSRALTISRTETLRAYRNATYDNYQANSDVVKGYVWVSDLSANTCFPAGTPITTRRGPVPIEQVRVGDEVLTHNGRYRRVLRLMERPYEGDMVTVRAGDREVTATSNHPFLVERHGQLDWVEAGGLRLGDRVFCEVDGGAQIRDHRLGDDAVEGRIWQAHHPIAPALQPERLAGILGLHARRAMPVHAVDLQRGVGGWQKEVDGIAPTRREVFLPEVHAQRLKAAPRVGLRFRLAGEASIAGHRAEAAQADLARPRAERHAAGETRHALRRPAARLGAVLDASSRAEDRAATGTRLPFQRVGTLGVRGAVARRRAMQSTDTGRRAERLAAVGADAHGEGGSAKARLRAEAPRSRSVGTERLAAVGADARNARSRLLATRGVGVELLIAPVALARAEAPGQRRRLIKDGSANFARLFHVSIIDSLRTHAKVASTTVYNLTVEDDHSYVAAGFVVHNCGECLALNGEAFDFGEEPDTHPNCRCTLIPNTASWGDLLDASGLPQAADEEDIPETNPAERVQSGADWFARQSAATQREILGPSKFALYATGQLELSDLVGERHDATWGRVRYEKSLSELGFSARHVKQAQARVDNMDLHSAAYRAELLARVRASQAGANGDQ